MANSSFTPPTTSEPKFPSYKLKRGHVLREVVREIRDDIRHVSGKLLRSLSGRSLSARSLVKDEEAEEEHGSGDKQINQEPH